MSAQLAEIYTQMMEAVEEIDTKLDSLSGGKATGKRKIVSQLMEKHEIIWSQAVNDIVSFVSGQSPEVQTAVVSALETALRKNFDKSVNSYVEALVDSQPVQEPLVNEEEAAVLSGQRSELYQQIKAIVGLAESIGEGPFEMPKMRRGSTGKRGPRNLSLFTFWIDGEEVDMTIGQIAKENGYELAGDLTKALRASGFDTKDGDAFEDFELPNGKKLTGQRDDSEEEDEPEED